MLSARALHVLPRISVHMVRAPLLHALLLLCALPACAQTGTPPVLTRPPDAPYPAEARKAHMTGEAVVAFSIDRDGKTSRVHAVFGPQPLSSGLRDEIRKWRFVTPLPHDAQKDFVAVYTYSIVDPREQLGEASSKPPADADMEPGPIYAVSGVVQSVDNRQTIDATPAVRNK